ncbi:MAG: hypothetical protein JSR54_18400 [Proteobacteria bacterium]|nr:hypothetical protein [Pseudomonadota bacterium]
MASPYEELISSITAAGVPEVEARHAARRCAMAMAATGAVGAAAGMAFAFFMSRNPVASIPQGLVGGAVGAGYALIKAPQCAEVREAIRFWNTASF